jgi:energy-coupling factor transporter ATP-binding protein EcfA2
MSYKVFLVEDEIVTREGIRDKVGWQAHGFEFCGEAPDGEIALPLLQRLKIDIDVTRTLGDYSVAIQQMAAIVRALEVSSAKILILDEPTSSLDAKETAQLFDVMRRLQSEGVGIVFITHFMDQVYEVADRITVLRNGKLVGTYDTASLPRLELIRKMIGRSLTEFDDMSKIKLESAKNIQGPLVLEAEGLGRTGSLEPIDLKLHAGGCSAPPAAAHRRGGRTGRDRRHRAVAQQIPGRVTVHSPQCLDADRGGVPAQAVPPGSGRQPDRGRGNPDVRAQRRTHLSRRAICHLPRWADRG